MVGTGLCVAVMKKRKETIEQDKNKCGLTSQQILADGFYFDWVENTVRVYGLEEDVIYHLCKKAPMEPLFEQKNAELKEAATHIIVDRMGQGKRTTKKDVIAILQELRAKDKKDSEDGKQSESGEQIEPRAQLIHGDFKEVLPTIEAESLDLVFTDPPYDIQSLDLWEDLARESERILKPGGFLATYASVNTLPLTLDSIGAHLNYYWTVAVTHTHGQARFWKYKMWRGWKPILIFVKGERDEAKHSWLNDVISEGASDTKDVHEWSQPAAHAKIIIEAFCDGTSKIIDPMCGAATIPIEAVRLGYEAIGIEKDEVRYNKALERVKNVEN
jgi:16S rRNA G966 N2-methylase RsmD